jgi:hypothetical protein
VVVLVAGPIIERDTNPSTGQREGRLTELPGGHTIAA